MFWAAQGGLGIPRLFTLGLLDRGHLARVGYLASHVCERKRSSYFGTYDITIFLPIIPLRPLIVQRERTASPGQRLPVTIRH